ncbi:helix-turn-helix domain-containing protein [Sciscionella marina]|uniref:helix-turn-helix domain-containing protein n=1 Tax=Sciscionella marina TaxID=508770 RepID=UPI00036FDBAC|nr:helix-turn-helix domain-containing protein [Sciscionella marina]
MAEVDDPLPPILVDRSTMRVIDGMHRLLAAVAKGQTVIGVEFFDGTEEDAFLRAVEANVTHGLPLSVEDRRAAAVRILTSHPHKSDRAIADVSGLSARTVGNVRRGLGGAITEPVARVGKDGKIHPLNKAEGRIRAARLMEEYPDASLREIARRAGVSPATVSDVRRRLASGQPAVVERKTRTDDAVRGPGSIVAQRQRTEQRDSDPSQHDPVILLEKLLRDPALRNKEEGRQLLRLLHRNAVEKHGLPQLATAVPEHCAEVVHGLAQHYADMWSGFAKLLR